MKHRVALLTLILAPCISAAWAQPTSGDEGYSHEFATRQDKAAGVTSEMIDCITAETKRQDTALNQRYKALIANLAPVRKNALLAAQRAWISFCDLNCRFYGDPDGGTMARVAASGCILQATTAHAKELQNLNDNGN